MPAIEIPLFKENALESLAELAKNLITGRAKRSMTVIYARRPYKDGNTGKALQCAGWITWVDNDTSTGELFRKVAMGWVPLPKYGTITAYQEEGTSPWEQILRHPDGPGEFPADQLLEFGWFDSERVPVQGVRFPALAGQTIRIIPCPDCHDRTFQQPLHLAIHCRNQHSYDRLDIEALGRELGIDFTKELYKGRPREIVYEYDGPLAPEPEPQAPPNVTVEVQQVRGRASSARHE